MPETQDDFIGRDADIARLRGLLGGPARLVTIVGGAGLGKTRLALELARLDGAVVMRLADARTIDDVLAAVAAAFEVPPAATNREAVAARVARAIAARGELVLVLDNLCALRRLREATLPADALAAWPHRTAVPPSGRTSASHPFVRGLGETDRPASCAGHHSGEDACSEGWAGLFCSSVGRVRAHQRALKPATWIFIVDTEIPR